MIAGGSFIDLLVGQCYVGTRDAARYIKNPGISL